MVEQGLELGQQQGLSGSQGLGTYSRRLDPVWRIALVALPILGLMYVAARSNYLLFHAAAEGFAVVVASVIYVLTTRTYKYSNKTYLLFLGNAYLFIATLDFLHTLTYKGMGVFPGYGTNTPTQLWIAGRYLDGFTLLLAPFFFGRRSFPQRRVFGAYLAVTGALIALIMWLRAFPTCYVDGQGLTPFKVGSEYVICLLLLAAIFHLGHHRRQIEASTYRLLVTAMVVTILAELSFTLYTDVYGIMNFAGHALKIVAYYLVYRGIVVQGLEAPYTEIRQLNENLENRVRERTAELEAIVSSIPAGIVINDPGGEFVFMNDTAEIMLGYGPGDWKRPLQERTRMLRLETDEGGPVAPEQTPTARALRGETVRDSVMVLHPPDGRDLWISSSSAPIVGSKGDVLGAVAIFMDITQMRQLQQQLELLLQELQARNEELQAQSEELQAQNEELRAISQALVEAQGKLVESERRYRTLFEQLAEGFALHEIVLDENGRPSDYRFLELNPAFEQLTGLTRDVIGRTVREVLPGVEQHWIDTYGVVALTGQPARFENYAQPLGRHYEVIAFSPAQGQFATLFDDITERKQAESERERLLQEVGNLAAVAQHHATELEVANKELEAFAYSVSHDLRAPLRHIDGFSKILLQAYADRLDEQGQQYLQFLRNGSQKMDQLLDALLMLSRVTRAEMRRQPVDLSALAQAVLADLCKEQSERPVELTIDPGVVAEGDPQLLRVVLENLLGNAWKFTSKRAVAKIQFGVTRQGDQLVCFVKDNGAGFDMAYADKLFGAFQRLHSGGEFPGTGIGLATVQRIVRRHGGQVWAEGAVDQGATFYFTLGQ